MLKILEKRYPSQMGWLWHQMGSCTTEASEVYQYDIDFRDNVTRKWCIRLG